MKSIGKAAEFLRKAAAALRGKAGVLRARLLFLASLRRRAAVVGAISRHIRALAPRHQQGKEKPPSVHCRDFAPVKKHTDADEERAVVGVSLPELAALFEEIDADSDGDGSYPDWTLALHSLFDDEDHDSHGGGDEEQCRDGDLSEAALDEDDEPSVIDVIRSRREGDGQEFRIEDEIDQAADMFITRVRRRMGAQSPEIAFI